MQIRKIFISYSWTTPQHEAWVLQLAHRLTHDGVHVVLDKWDLKPGQDKYTFMEQMVHAEDIDKVLIILDKKYTERANNRSGGVGTETTIISGKVYESATQEKFIPIVAERDENGHAFLPTYLGTRIYIDLSDESGFEDSYEQLLRQIYEAPLLARPKLGSAPKYLLSDSPVSYRTSSILRSFDAQMDRFPQRINTISRDFFETLFKDLSTFSMVDNYPDWLSFGETLADNLTRMKPLKDDYVEFILKVGTPGSGFDSDILISFLEELTALLSPAENQGSWNPNSFANYKFIIHELWLCTVAVGLKKENYDLLSNLFQTTYFSKERHKNKEAKGFDMFYNYLDDELRYYIKHTTGQNLISAHAHVLISRISEHLKKIDITFADLLCYYISQLRNLEWFPMTYIYHDEYNASFPILSKLVSKKHFEKVKVLFGYETADEMKQAFGAFQDKSERGYSSARGYILPASRFIKADQICTFL